MKIYEVTSENIDFIYECLSDFQNTDMDAQINDRGIYPSEVRSVRMPQFQDVITFETNRTSFVIRPGHTVHLDDESFVVVHPGANFQFSAKVTDWHITDVKKITPLSYDDVIQKLGEDV